MCGTKASSITGWEACCAKPLSVRISLQEDHFPGGLRHSWTSPHNTWSGKVRCSHCPVGLDHRRWLIIDVGDSCTRDSRFERRCQHKICVELPQKLNFLHLFCSHTCRRKGFVAVSFELLLFLLSVQGNWLCAFHPCQQMAKMDAELEGPDDGGHDRFWCIGLGWWWLRCCICLSLSHVLTASPFPNPKHQDCLRGRDDGITGVCWWFRCWFPTKNICNGHPLHVGGSDDVMLGDLVGDAQGSRTVGCWGTRDVWCALSVRPICILYTDTVNTIKRVRIIYCI